jgi:hypothetical protein
MPSIVMLNTVMLSIVLLSVLFIIMLNVVMLSAMVPFSGLFFQLIYNLSITHLFKLPSYQAYLVETL